MVKICPSTAIQRNWINSCIFLRPVASCSPLIAVRARCTVKPTCVLRLGPATAVLVGSVIFAFSLSAKYIRFPAHTPCGCGRGVCIHEAGCCRSQEGAHDEIFYEKASPGAGNVAI